ncbi:hypothetical protein CC86DRAFT_392896 [Ophiobolus disseminans]|uniref:DASH complex subunit DUO1 n=1 Tax=Ophiobolus disseminans TaxID=1469910 RepID=A0A6A7A5W9_9PLEO|nr:hypothetical protein CC86DRAFT_392896 [Ophiobolus disseminans]
MDPPNMGALELSDSDSDALFDTPAARKTKKKPQQASTDAGEGAAGGKARAKESHYTTEEAREVALRRELESIKNVNKVIEGVVESLQKAKDNMETVSKTVQNASTLLQTWTRILSQTEHNQRLILNPQWQGASDDLVAIEEEETNRQQAAERRVAEEQARREAAARKLEEERRRAEAPPRAGTRGRGRGTRGRGTTTPTPPAGGYVAVGGQAGRGLNRSGSTGGRAGSGIGRGLRGRGRGLS